MVTQVGTPTATSFGSYSTTQAPATVTNTWSGTQPRTAGDLMVAVVTFTTDTSTSTSAVTQHTGTSGWTEIADVSNSGSTTAYSRASMWYKVATGADAAPSFDCSFTVTSTGRSACTLFELASVNATPIDKSGTYSSGAGGTSLSTWSVTTSGSVAATGEFAISCFASRAQASATITYTAGTSWTNFGNDGATNTENHNAVDYYAGPPSGSTLTDAATVTTETVYVAGIVAVFAAGGASSTPIQQPQRGGRTWSLRHQRHQISAFAQPVVIILTPGGSATPGLLVPGFAVPGLPLVEPAIPTVILIDHAPYTISQYGGFF